MTTSEYNYLETRLHSGDAYSKLSYWSAATASYGDHLTLVTIDTQDGHIKVLLNHHVENSLLSNNGDMKWPYRRTTASWGDQLDYGDMI